LESLPSNGFLSFSAFTIRFPLCFFVVFSETNEKRFEIADANTPGGPTNFFFFVIERNESEDASNEDEHEAKIGFGDQSEQHLGFLTAFDFGFSPVVAPTWQ